MGSGDHSLQAPRRARTLRARAAESARLAGPDVRSRNWTRRKRERLDASYGQVQQEEEEEAAEEEEQQHEGAEDDAEQEAARHDPTRLEEEQTRPEKRR